MNEILIRNVRIPSLTDKKIRSADILLSKDRIIDISKKISRDNVTVIDGKRDLILPSFVDLAADIHHPDNNEREDIASGSLAALRGGYSDILVRDKGDDITNIYSHCRVHVCSCREGSPFLYADDLNAHELSQLMKRASAHTSLLFLSPAPDPLYPNSCVTEGRTASMLKLPCEPPSAEARRISEYLILAEENDCRIHIRGISCAKSIELIRHAKADGIKVTASTSPCYFSLTASDLFFIGANAKVYPPLREEYDRMAVIEGIKDGTIDCIDSGHTPRTRAEKSGTVSDAAAGATGLQSCFSAVVTYLLVPGHIDIFRLCELLCLAPARILGLKAPKEIDTDCRAFNLASVSSEFIFSENYIKGKSTNSPFINMSLCGNIRETYILRNESN